MGDVFDRIVSRAATGPATPAGLTMRRTPAFGAPDGLVTEADPVGSETWAGTGASARPGALPLAPNASANRPPAGERRDEPEPGTLTSAGEPPRGPAAPRLERERTDPAVSVPARARLSLRDPADEAPPEGPRAREAPVPAPSGRQAPPADAAAARVGLRTRPQPSRHDPAAGASARTVSAAELLRGHLAPALEDRGLLGAGDDARLTAAGLDPIEVPVGGDVHLHLGHVEVVQQGAAPPPPEPSRPEVADPARERVDHADYLARQQRRWS